MLEVTCSCHQKLSMDLKPIVVHINSKILALESIKLTQINMD